MTFEVKLFITFVATHPCMLVTKFGQNPLKHVEGEANCQKEEEEEEEEEEERNRKNKRVMRSDA